MVLGPANFTTLAPAAINTIFTHLGRSTSVATLFASWVAALGGPAVRENTSVYSCAAFSKLSAGSHREHEHLSAGASTADGIEIAG